jgi:hypothetical protein
MSQDHESQPLPTHSTNLADVISRATHDLNNLLMMISSHAELLALRHRDDADVQQRTARILAAIASATQLTHQLQVLARQD